MSDEDKQKQIEANNKMNLMVDFLIEDSGNAYQAIKRLLCAITDRDYIIAGVYMGLLGKVEYKTFIELLSERTKEVESREQSYHSREMYPSGKRYSLGCLLL